MNIQGNIGWINVCRTDPSKSYVIGGSEEANEEIRNKYLGDDYKLPDQAKSYYELNAKGISRLELTSENYNDIMKIKGMPSSCLSGSYGGQVIQNMKDMMDSYYSGEMSAEDVQQKIKNICIDMRVEMVQQRYTNGYNAKDNQQILEDIYGFLQKINVNAAYAANEREGAVLTGVYNRLYFEEEIKMWTGNAGIVVIDVDDFKLCNDTYGHLTGDMALAAVAGVIWRCIRREDTLVRYGGDEFVLVLPEIKEDGLVEKLQEIQEKIQNAVIPGYSNIQLSVSMGAVISQNESVEHAMLRARKLMYQAKNKKNMAITENNMIDHEGKIHAQKQPEKMIPEILVVDDEEVNRTLLDMIFSKDYHVLQAESGEKCIEILEQQVNSISLVLLDVVLPKMDGFDVLTYMNKNHWIEDIPVIMMSGADAPEAVKRAYALGAVDFVSKPCDAQIVYQRVTNTMKLYAKQRRLTSLITAQINEKEKNSEMLIHILSHIVEFRNGESGSHVLHIHKLTEMLLERLAQKTEKYHLDGDTRAMIALASSLHDIGKIGVDEKILNKPGKLTKEEFEIMKTHTVIGAEMLEQLGIYQNEPLVKIAHQICRWHHERYDGKGYPDGLVGDEIPISAQVVSVADVYDALASERVYKKAVPHEKVLEMILHGECGQFNPILIECLQEISSRIRSECYDEEQET